jgi:hypothetical protein
MSYQFRPAKRSEAKPLVGLYAESGCGKTFSALLLARGFVGPQGRIGMIETESGRGEAFSDPAEYPEIGGYEVLSLRADFSPQAYGAALSAAEAAKLDALIIDSASHEWEGAGGVLSMAAENQAAGKKGPIVWQKPKLDHQRHFMLRLMQTPIPLVIVCMRAKYPMKEVPKPGGGKEWVRSDQLEPKQADDILFEMFAHGWIDREHRLHVTKLTNKSLDRVFLDRQPISLDTGRRLAEWAKGAGAPAAAEQQPYRAAMNDGSVRQFDNAAAWQSLMLRAIDQLGPRPDALRRFRAANGPIMAAFPEDAREHAFSVSEAFDKALEGAAA